MWAMSSGAGAGSAVLGLVSTAGSLTSKTSRPQPVQAIGQLGGGQRGDRRGIGEYECDPLGRQCRIDRQIRRTGFQHRHNRRDGLSGPGRQQRHTLPWAYPVAGQQMRQPVGGLIELAVGPRTLPAADRHRIRGARHLRGEQHRNRHRRRGLGQHRPVAQPIQPSVLSLVQQIHR